MYNLITDPEELKEFYRDSMQNSGVRDTIQTAALVGILEQLKRIADLMEETKNAE